MNPSFMNNPSVHTFMKINWNFFMIIILDLLKNIPNTQEVNEINTVTKPDKKTKYNAQVQIIFIKTYRKNNQKKKLRQSHFS